MRLEFWECTENVTKSKQLDDIYMGRLISVSRGEYLLNFPVMNTGKDGLYYDINKGFMSPPVFLPAQKVSDILAFEN